MSVYASMSPEAIELLNALKTGLDWTWTSEHPDGALMQHHGIYAGNRFLGGRLSLSICPQGFRGAGVVVVCNVADKRYDASHNLLNPWTKDEIDLLRSLVAACGSDVVDEWNGVGCDTASFSPARRASRGVMRLVETYHKGCPKHPEKRVFCDCGWYRRGHDKVKLPEGWA